MVGADSRRIGQRPLLNPSTCLEVANNAERCQEQLTTEASSFDGVSPVEATLP